MNKKRIAFRIVAAILGGSLVGLVFNLVIAVQVNAWQVYGILVPVIILGILALNSLSLIRNGQMEKGMWRIIVGMLVILPPFVLLISGVGIILGLIIVITAYLYASQTLPAEDVRRILFASLGVGALTASTDFLTLEYRLQIPEIQAFAPAITVFTLLFIGFFVVRRAWGRSLRNKLLVAFIGVTVFAVGALAMYVYISTSGILREGLERELTQHTAEVGIRLGDVLNEQVNTLTTLSLNEVLRTSVETQNDSYTGSTDTIQAKLYAEDERWQAVNETNNNSDFLVQWRLTNAVAQELLEYQKIFPANVEVFVTDVYGGLVGATNRTSDYYQADEDWWQAAYNNGQGAVYISEPEFDESSDALAVLIAMPLKNYQTGEIVGVLRTTYLASALTGILQEEVGQSGETDLFIPGEVVSHIHAGQFESVEAGKFEQLRAVADQGMAEMDYESVQSVVVQAPMRTLGGNSTVDSLGWIVLFHQQQQEAFAPLNSQVRGSLILMAVVVVLAIAAAYGLSVFLIGPMAKLTKTAEEVAAGDLSSRAEVTTSDEIGTLASTFNSMTSQLQETLQGLEQRVSARTRDLEIVAEVGTATATILESSRLLQEVVDLTKERFDLYHSHIYLLDEKGENLILTSGAGEPGRVMVAEGHSIPLDREQSLVARAARERKGVTVNDVTQAPDFLPNPLLPDTRSELAVPMIVGGNVIGVFDIQSEQVGRFTESDVNIQTTMAAQLATSIQNVRSFEKSKKQAELETVVNSIGQRIQRTTTIEDTLQTAIRELGTAIGASRVKASLRSASTSAELTSFELAKPVLTADAEHKNGSGSVDPRSAYAD
jgi:GAF domain-containing protein